MIEVRVPKRALFDNEVHTGMFLLKQLKDAGVPMQGALFPLAPEYGVLEIEDDLVASDVVVYRWRP